MNVRLDRRSGVTAASPEKLERGGKRKDRHNEHINERGISNRLHGDAKESRLRPFVFWPRTRTGEPKVHPCSSRQNIASQLKGDHQAIVSSSSHRPESTPVVGIHGYDAPDPTSIDCDRKRCGSIPSGGRGQSCTREIPSKIEGGCGGRVAALQVPKYHGGCLGLRNDPIPKRQTRLMPEMR
jgi:hypothetical protein